MFFEDNEEVVADRWLRSTPARLNKFKRLALLSPRVRTGARARVYPRPSTSAGHLAHLVLSGVAFVDVSLLAPALAL